MAILIKNMEMPKCCGECPMSQLVNDNQYAYCHLLKKGTKVGYMLKDCPLVELSPHGRLVDADAFIEKNKEGFETPWEEHGARIGTIKVPLRPVEEAINNAPTILEASK